MPQVFQVLRCYKCLVFQIHQTKKSNKFECKMCGEKQSIKRHYGLGNGLECRKHVQRLNAMRGEIDNSKCFSDNNCSDDDEKVDNLKIPKAVIETTQINMSSKWSDFVETEEITDTPSPSADTMYLNNTEVVLELPKKRQKMLGRVNQQKYKNKLSNESAPEDLNNIKTESTPHVTLNESNICDNYDNKLMTNGNKFKTPLCYNNLPSNSLKNENTILNSNHIQTQSKRSVEFQSTNNTKHMKTNSSDSRQNTFNKEKKSCFVPPPINKNSKWAKFAAEDIELPEASEESINSTDEGNEIPIYETLSHEKSKSIYHVLPSITKNDENNPHRVKNLENKTNDPQALFALCDEEDIDDYLSI